MPGDRKRRDRVRSGRLRRSLKPIGLGARTAASRASTAARSVGRSDAIKEQRRREFHERTAALYARELGDMKGALMKIGQLLSFVDAGLVPPAYRQVYSRAMGGLLANAPPMDMSVVDAVVEEELGAPAKEIFAWFSPDAIAAASIGQVHEARLADGTPVAVKVQYPGVADAIDDDLSNAELLATFMRLAQSVMGGMAPRADPRVMVGELRERICEELDYSIEARNQAYFGKLFDGHPFIQIPPVCKELSTKRVLTTGLASGRRWEDALTASKALRDAWGETIYRFALTSLDQYSAFNADPHPGNYIFNDDGTVTFLDFGCVKYMPPDQMHLNVGLIRAVIDGRGGDFKDMLVHGGYLPADDPIEPSRLVEWYAGALSYMHGAPYTFKHEDVANFIRQIYDPRGEWGDIVRRFTAPKDFTLVTRIDLGLWSVLASLQATNDWLAISEEIWGIGPPTTDLGRLHAQWQDGMTNCAGWPPPHPAQVEHFEASVASMGFDPLADDFQDDPYADYERMRTQGPVHWLPPGVYLITRYEDCLALLRDPRLSADPTRSDLYDALVTPIWGEGSAVDRLIRQLLLFMDPPDHERLRSLVASAFSRRAVEDLRPRIQAITDDLLETAKPTFDVVEEFAYPLPVRVIAELLGVPMSDRERFGSWSQDLVGLLSLDAPAVEDTAKANATLETFLAYFADLAGERRRRPAEDLLTHLGQAEQAGDRLSNDELLATCVLLLVAGHETTANLIGNAAIALMNDRRALARLRDDPSIATAAVEELLRFDSPVQATARTTLDEISVGAKVIPAGQRIVLLLGSANRDPSVFTEPDTIDFDRPHNQHLSFGGGIHFCLGAPLARLEARIALPALARRLDNASMADEIEWKRTFPIRGPLHLRVEQ